MSLSSCCYCCYCCYCCLCCCHFPCCFVVIIVVVVFVDVIVVVVVFVRWSLVSEGEVQAPLTSWTSAQLKPQHPLPLSLLLDLVVVVIVVVVVNVFVVVFVVARWSVRGKCSCSSAQLKPQRPLLLSLLLDLGVFRKVVLPDPTSRFLGQRTASTLVEAYCSKQCGSPPRQTEPTIVPPRHRCIVGKCQNVVPAVID